MYVEPRTMMHRWTDGGGKKKGSSMHHKNEGENGNDQALSSLRADQHTECRPAARRPTSPSGDKSVWLRVETRMSSQQEAMRDRQDVLTDRTAADASTFRKHAPTLRPTDRGTSRGSAREPSSSRTTRHQRRTSSSSPSKSTGAPASAI